MRIFAIPILRNHFTYFCHGKPKRGTYLSKITDFAAKKWDQLYHAEKTSWKGKLYTTGQRLLDKIDHQEYFLKSIPLKEEVEKNLSSKEDVNVKNNIQLSEKEGKYAAEKKKNDDNVVKPEQILTTLEQMLGQRLPYHRKYMIYSALCVPLTSTFTLIPKILLIFVNDHLGFSFAAKAFKGAQYLQLIIGDKRLTPTDSSILDQIYDGIDLNNCDILDENRIHQIAHEFNVLTMDVDVKRARHQILEKIKPESKEEHAKVDNRYNNNDGVNKEKTEKR
ncbi:17989_t:CDS:2 [Cetraspora pellucida]|uniref:17989_t:CDS:1 n=1 Tax=Cetraspora pellucida TaxID=1433469 RepID=A0A9N9IAH0_9GLOM|nr:17989_t:CDS:2 [Cetraspora pellucida]